jgi:GH25 family lysozyme M1 (1,4-beta-N-acetylmuramidase)
MNYTNPAYLAQYFDNSTLRYDLWLAQWPSKPDPDKPPRECGIWQYTSKGKVNGILGNVDMDAGYKDYPTIIRNAGLNNLVPKQEPKTLEERVAALEAWAKTQGMA